MKTKYGIWCVVFMCLAILPCEAKEHLVFSRPQYRKGTVTLTGERILKEAYERLGVDFEFRELPSTRALVMSNYGGTDGEFLRLPGLERTYPNLVMISVPIGFIDIVVYTKDSEFAVEGWHSLAPYSIGVVKGFQLVEAKTKGMQVEAVTTLKQAFLMLEAGRSDVVVDSRSTDTECELKGLNLKDIRILEPPLDQLVLYHYLHKRHAALAKKLEAILTCMEQEGEFKTIQEQVVQNFRCGQ